MYERQKLFEQVKQGVDLTQESRSASRGCGGGTKLVGQMGEVMWMCEVAR